MDYEKAVIYDSDIAFKAKGKDFIVKPLPLKYIANGEFNDSKFHYPRDRDDPGRYQLLNVTDADRREALDKFMKLLLFHDGLPVSLEQACEWDWDITDIGRWLDLVVQVSG